jgi:hypothetical protein
MVKVQSIIRNNNMSLKKKKIDTVFLLFSAVCIFHFLVVLNGIVVCIYV